MPVFSVIIPTYNRSEFIANAVQSVLNQTYKDFEVLIIDDGSTDNTKEIVEQFPDPRIRYFYQENSERSAARNRGIELSKGEWVCFLDSDDEYLPKHLEVLNKRINQVPMKRIILTGIQIQTNTQLCLHPLINNYSENILTEILSKFILMNTVCVHSEIIKRNQFDLRFRIWEDTHLWLRIAAQFPLEQLNEYTCQQNISENGTVMEIFRKVHMKDVNQYISAIQDLQINYMNIIKNRISEVQFLNYKDEKLRMFLYQARQNMQLYVALKIWFKAMLNRPSGYLISEFPKIFLNSIRLGIHVK